MNQINKRIWITGASSGIGRALACIYAERGARLILTARNREALHTIKKEWGSAAEISILPADLTDLDALPQLARKAENEYNGIDLLINNAGQSMRAPAVDTDLEVYKRMFTLNVLSSIALTKSVLPGMISRGEGHVAVVTSIAGEIAAPLRSGYSAAKHALHGFYNSLRTEIFGKNITISLIVPGFVRTSVSKHALTGTGGAYNVMSKKQASAVTPEKCALQIVKGLEKKKSHFYVAMDVKAWAAVILNHFFPGIYIRILNLIDVT